ncbi:MAG: hypothetical protein JSS34_03390 [Proteobacteria bacterium]|nr:hypothetical protein [Pseudomonadota bacterium]
MTKNYKVWDKVGASLLVVGFCLAGMGTVFAGKHEKRKAEEDFSEERPSQVLRTKEHVDILGIQENDEKKDGSHSPIVEVFDDEVDVVVPSGLLTPLTVSKGIPPVLGSPLMPMSKSQATPDVVSMMEKRMDIARGLPLAQGIVTRRDGKLLHISENVYQELQTNGAIAIVDLLVGAVCDEGKEEAGPWKHHDKEKKSKRLVYITAQKGGDTRRIGETKEEIFEYVHKNTSIIFRGSPKRKGGLSVKQSCLLEREYEAGDGSLRKITSAAQDLTIKHAHVRFEHDLTGGASYQVLNSFVEYEAVRQDVLQAEINRSVSFGHLRRMSPSLHEGSNIFSKILTVYINPIDAQDFGNISEESKVVYSEKVWHYPTNSQHWQHADAGLKSFRVYSSDRSGRVLPSSDSQEDFVDYRESHVDILPDHASQQNMHTINEHRCRVTTYYTRPDGSLYPVSAYLQLPLTKTHLGFRDDFREEKSYQLLRLAVSYRTDKGTEGSVIINPRYEVSSLPFAHEKFFDPFQPEDNILTRTARVFINVSNAVSFPGNGGQNGQMLQILEEVIKHRPDQSSDWSHKNADHRSARVYKGDKIGRIENFPQEGPVYVPHIEEELGIVAIGDFSDINGVPGEQRCDITVSYLRPDQTRYNLTFPKSLSLDKEHVGFEHVIEEKRSYESVKLSVTHNIPTSSGQSISRKLEIASSYRISSRPFLLSIEKQEWEDDRVAHESKLYERFSLSPSAALGRHKPNTDKMYVRGNLLETKQHDLLWFGRGYEIPHSKKRYK